MEISIEVTLSYLPLHTQRIRVNILKINIRQVGCFVSAIYSLRMVFCFFLSILQSSLKLLWLVKSSHLEMVEDSSLDCPVLLLHTP